MALQRKKISLRHNVLRIFLKKNFAERKKGCIFASDFKRVEKTIEMMAL
jgi:hypothetical protein